MSFKILSKGLVVLAVGFLCLAAILVLVAGFIAVVVFLNKLRSKNRL